MIEHISKITTNGKSHYNVYYISGYKRKYADKENLPDGVLNVLLNGNYFSKYITSANGNVTKYERFTPNR